MNAVETDETHKAVDVECADQQLSGHVPNADDLDSAANRGDPGDRWCPETQTEFSVSSTPDPRSYDGIATEVAVRNIDSCTGGVHGSPGWICADLAVGNASNVGVCIQDCEDDDCVELTACDAWWASPDIWIDNDDDGDDDLPAEGITNHLWYRVHNLTPEPLSGAEIKLYFGNPAMGQLWPTTAMALIASVDIPIMGAPPASLCVGRVDFVYPEPAQYVDHYCIAAIVTHPQAPQNSYYAPNDNNVAQVNHQVLIGRAEPTETGIDEVLVADGVEALGASGAEALEARVSDLASEGALACTGYFSKRSKIKLYDGFNPTGGQVTAEVLLGSPPTYDDVVLPTNWHVSIRPSTGPFTLWPEHSDSIEVWVWSRNGTDGESAHIPLTLVNTATEEPMGGVVLDYKIDCTEPRTPTTTAAHWRYMPPDYMVGPTVEVTWSKVDLDVDGKGEQVERYLIYRSDNQGSVEILVDEVAVDANPDKSDIQWYDSLIPTCDVIYYYRVRAVDAAGNYGDYSNQIVLSCATSGVGRGEGGAGDVGQMTAGAVPNPFGPATVVSFSIASPGRVVLKVYDVAGRPVRTLMDGHREPDHYQVSWDGRDGSGNPVGPGVYFYRLEGPGIVQTRKLVRVE
jgi:hypothetical protein